MDIFSALLAYLHFGSIMLLAALIATEFRLLQGPLDAKAVEMLSRVDIAYVSCGFMVLLSGAVRFGITSMGILFIGGNPLFWLKMLLFGVLAMASLYLSWRYSRWVHLARMDSSFRVAPSEMGTARMLVKFQIALLALLPLLAVMMVRGIAR
jgi:putative membrane protein